MKIEKVNDNQIRCTLTKEDLADRNIKLSELAYGSDKAKSLFKDMIQQANYEFGFEVNDIPLMVEAIPLPSESIILLITKVEYPDELDTRFSKFSEPEDEFADNESMDLDEDALARGAEEILQIFNELKKKDEESKKESLDGQENKLDSILEENADNEADKISVDEKNEQQENEAAVFGDLTKMFEFNDFDTVERLSRVLNGCYSGENDLYKDDRNNKYYLLIHKSEHTPAEFNKVCNMASEYAKQKNYTKSVGAYLNEHNDAIIVNDAIQVLADL